VLMAFLSRSAGSTHEILRLKKPKQLGPMKPDPVPPGHLDQCIVRGLVLDPPGKPPRPRRVLESPLAALVEHRRDELSRDDDEGEVDGLTRGTSLTDLYAFIPSPCRDSVNRNDLARIASGDDLQHLVCPSW